MPEDAVTESLDRARLLIQSDEFEAAEVELIKVISTGTLGDRLGDALYLIAVAQRYQRKLDHAAKTLRELLELQPENARAWQERGHVCLSANDLERARTAYEQAVRRNPALLASWKALVNLYRMAGLAEEVGLAEQEAAYLDALPEPLLGALSLFNEGKLFKADQLCRHFLRKNQQHVEGMRLLAMIGEQLGVLLDAEFLLETALELEPEYTRLRYDYANLLLKMQKFEGARAETETLVAGDPGNLRYLALHANALAGVGDHEAAIAAYSTVINARPGQFVLHVMRGHAEKTVGRLEDAIRSYHQASELQPLYGDAYWSLANTKTYRFSAVEIEQMRSAEADARIGVDDRIHVCFALGKALEDAGAFEESFTYYERGNILKQEIVKHRRDFLEQRVAAQKAVCTAALFAARKGAGCPAPDPIFIVGLPRAGSTLLEQILASHSMVDGTLELPNVIALSQRLRGPIGQAAESERNPRYPGILAELEPDYFRRFGEQFIEDTRVYRQEAPRFIDKNPNNFFHIGLIHLMLPNARVIDARRHPMACCFSGFKQLFGQGQDFSYGLAEIGDYYRRYVELMDHWDDVLPGFVLRVQHEDVVDDLETQVRRMLDFCELPFEEDCLAFHKTERSVRTPSSEQVRQPIYRSGLDVWENYARWLEPLKRALGPDVRARYGIN
ncbi:MAG: sulfotransferase [Pseudomonadota bacterium]